MRSLEQPKEKRGAEKTRLASEREGQLGRKTGKEEAAEVECCREAEKRAKRPG